jgi:hypothetical protein
MVPLQLLVTAILKIKSNEIVTSDNKKQPVIKRNRNSVTFIVLENEGLSAKALFFTHQY